MTVSILDAMTNSGSSEFTTATISAGANRRYFIVTLNEHFSDASPRTSVTVGGVSLALLAVGNVATRNCSIALWSATEADIQAMSGLAISYAGGVASGSSTIQWTVRDAVQSGETSSALVAAGQVTSVATSLSRVDDSLTFAVGVASEDTLGNVTLTNPTQSGQYKFAGAAAYGSQADTAGTSDTTALFGTLRDMGVVAVNIGSATAAGPTITGPDSTTEGAATTQTGTLLDTVVTQSLVSGSYSIEQTITGQTTTTLDYVAESGVNLCTPPTPVSGVPLEATISAAGVTPYVVQQKADDGTNPPATRNITLNPEATHEVIQTMAGVANTTPDQSIFGSTLVTVEDNHQARVPKVVDGVTFTWFADGTFTTDIDKTVTFQYELFSPASGNWSAIDITVKSVQGVGVVVSATMTFTMIKSMTTTMVRS